MQDPQQLRISDADRHKVAEALREAAGEGRLELGELDERLEAAYAAKTYGDLVPITADLPAQVPQHPAQPRPARTTLPVGASHPNSVAIMSETKRQGPWLVGETHSAFAMMGSITLDLRQAHFSAKETTINAVAIMGETKVVVDDRTMVIVDGFGLMGEFKEQRARVEPDLDADSPVVRVKGLALMGSVSVQRRPAPGTTKNMLGWRNR
ncbi:MAG TPA: DUF1707 domain-containing protein [Nocardioidaceae bacterium]|nr:DUF1707 domain-containing protein [Nocardioidaceae bacterium]